MSQEIFWKVLPNWGEVRTCAYAWGFRCLW